jgi:hypothetical protein
MKRRVQFGRWVRWGVLGGSLPLALLGGACSSDDSGGATNNTLLPAFGEGNRAPGSAGSGTTQPPATGGPARTGEGTPTANGLGSAGSSSNSGGQAAPVQGSGGAGGSAAVVGTGGTGTATGGAGGAAPVGTGGAATQPPAGAAGAPATEPPPVGNNCPGLFFCDDFEGVAAGSSPNPALWSVIANYSRTAQAASVQVSAANSNSGNQAVRVTQGGRDGIIATVPQARFFMRAFLQVDAAPLGPVLIGAGTDQNSEVRLRIRQNSWAGINVSTGDAVFPNGIESGNCPTCVTLPVNTWFCAEMFVDNAARSTTLWIDGREAATVVNAGTWPAMPATPALFLGTMALQGGNTALWIDDVAAGPQRIGCN